MPSGSFVSFVSHDAGSKENSIFSLEFDTNKVGGNGLAVFLDF